MKNIEIPQTDLKTSLICFGGGSLVGLNKREAFSLLDTFYEAGGNFIDTANIYGKWLAEGKNTSEIMIGKWLTKRGKREDIVIGTKGAHPHLSTMGVPRLECQDIIKDLNESLEALQTEYIDLYWLHRDDENKPVAEILEILNEQVTKGKIRYFGCSNWKVDRIKQALNYASDHDMKTFVANQLMWSLAEPNYQAIGDSSLVAMNKKSLRFHKKTNLTAMPYSSQAKGFFSKLKYRTGNVEKLGDELLKKYYNEENIKRYQRIVKLARYLSKSVSQIVLSYLVSQSFPVIPIAGFSNRKQLTESIKAADLKLTSEMIAYLETGEGQLSFIN